MAEVAGLALGTVALVSLFSTCTDLIDRFEVAKSREYDYDLACLKLSVLRSRLKTWADVLEGHGLINDEEKGSVTWPQDQDVIAASLIGIKSILGNAEILEYKYSLGPRKRAGIAGLLTVASKLGHPQGTGPRSWHQKTRLLVFRRTSGWVIRDKNKFDTLLTDLSFFIDNLEKVLGRDTMPKNKRTGTGRNKHVKQEGEAAAFTSSSDKSDHRSANSCQSETHTGTISPDIEAREGETRRTELRKDHTMPWTVASNTHKVSNISPTARPLVLSGIVGEVTIPMTPKGQHNNYEVNGIDGRPVIVSGHTAGDVAMEMARLHYADSHRQDRTDTAKKWTAENPAPGPAYTHRRKQKLLPAIDPNPRGVSRSERHIHGRSYDHS